MSDVESIDAAHTRLQAQADQTLTAIRSLSTKLQGAAAGGDTLAREWNLDLREVALAIQAEQQQVGALIQALHDFVVANAHQPVATAPYQMPTPQPYQPAPQQYQPAPQQYQPAPQQYQQPAQQGGGLLSRFMGGGFGSAMASGAGMGLGFGLAENIIDDIF